MSEQWAAEFVGGPLDGQRHFYGAGIHTIHIPMLHPEWRDMPNYEGNRPIVHGTYRKSDQLTADGAAWRAVWTPPA